MAYEKYENVDPEQFMQLMGPSAVDGQIRDAIRACWLMLPVERRNTKEVEDEMRRVFERAINDFKSDAASLRGAKAT